MKIKTLPSKVKFKVKSLLLDWQYNFTLSRIILKHKIQASSRDLLHELFGNSNDEFWFWAYTDGYDKNANLRQLLPTLPEPEIQAHFTGQSGVSTLKQAFSAYQLFKSIAQKMDKQIEEDSKILDFGCGWGRIIRFFLKDVKASCLYGIDHNSKIIDVCKSQNIKGNFEIIDSFPPINFCNDYFDIIYAYSVFSHLSEELHQQWLKEFQRILKPGGLVIVTTREREYILRCEALRKKKDLPIYLKGDAASFLKTEESLEDYDQGKYCFDDCYELGTYGQACIPKKYVEREWIKYFKTVDFIENTVHQSFDQNVIIAKK